MRVSNSADTAPSSKRAQVLDEHDLYWQADQLYDQLSALETVCPGCERSCEASAGVIKYGFTPDNKQRYKCKPCSLTFTEQKPRAGPPVPLHPPNTGLASVLRLPCPRLINGV